VEKIHSAISSSGATRSTASLAARLARSSRLSPADPTGSPIDPLTSSTSSMRARLRSSSHDACTCASTVGDGGFSVVVGCAGSSPFSGVMRGPVEPSKPRNPAAANRSCASSDCT
jgi:hypothetical protein